MLRGWIEIQLVNGQRLKYVRDVTFGDSGDSALSPDILYNQSYYEYGNTAGDTYLYQGDSSELLGSFNKILANYTSGDSLLAFPEFAGNTYILVRRNEDEPRTAAPQNLGGDTFILSQFAYRRYVVPVSSVVSISVVEIYAPQSNVYIP